MFKIFEKNVKFLCKKVKIFRTLIIDLNVVQFMLYFYLMVAIGLIAFSYGSLFKEEIMFMAGFILTVINLIVAIIYIVIHKCEG